MSRWLIINPIHDLGLSYMGGKFLALILAIIIGSILFFTFMKKDSEELSGFKKVLYDFLTFKTFTIKGILKFVYVIVALYFTIFGALYLFVSPLCGLLYLVVYNIIARLGFEFVMLLIAIKENTDMEVDDFDDILIVDEDDIEYVDEEEISEEPENKPKTSKKSE